MYNFWSDHENWVHLVVRIFSSPAGATDHLDFSQLTIIISIIPNKSWQNPMNIRIKTEEKIQ
jgi:hypothetical protein